MVDERQKSFNNKTSYIWVVWWFNEVYKLQSTKMQRFFHCGWHHCMAASVSLFFSASSTSISNLYYCNQLSHSTTEISEKSAVPMFEKSSNVSQMYEPETSIGWRLKMHKRKSWEFYTSVTGDQMCIFMVNIQFVTPIFHLFWITNSLWMCSLSGLLMIQIFISFAFQ